MTPVHLHGVVKNHGQILIKDLPFKDGQRVELIVRPEGKAKRGKRYPKVRDLIECGFIGMWEGREDIGDSAVFARQLRERSLCRSRSRPRPRSRNNG